MKPGHLAGLFFFLLPKRRKAVSTIGENHLLCDNDRHRKFETLLRF